METLRCLEEGWKVSWGEMLKYLQLELEGKFSE